MYVVAVRLCKIRSDLNLHKMCKIRSDLILHKANLVRKAL